MKVQCPACETEVKIDFEMKKNVTYNAICKKCMQFLQVTKKGTVEKAGK